MDGQLMATLSFYDALFSGELLMVANRKLPGFNSNNLTNSAWALATLGFNNETFMEAFIQSARHRLPAFSAQD